MFRVLLFGFKQTHGKTRDVHGDWMGELAGRDRLQCLRMAEGKVLKLMLVH
jgi:hypothetical protein